MCESFFATLSASCSIGVGSKTQTEARRTVLEFIENFYNPRRRHSSIGYLSPVDYERRHHAAAANPNAHKPAATVLAAVKDKPFERPQVGPSRRPPLCAAAARIVQAGRKKWLRQGRTKECLSAGGQPSVRSNRLIPNAQHSTRNRGKSHSKVHTLYCSTATTANPAIILPAPSQCRRGRRSIRQNGMADHILTEGRSRWRTLRRTSKGRPP